MTPLGHLKVSQFVADMAEGDAISKDCLEIDRILKGWGCRSKVYADRVHPGVRGKALPREAHNPDDEEMVILHYSLWSRSAEYLHQLRPQRLMMVYHNITPSEYFKGMNREAERATALGREALSRFVNITTLALGDSEYNRLELDALGFRKTGVLPIAMDFECLRERHNTSLLWGMPDDYVNLLSVGRIVPNKRLEDVIKIFYHYKRNLNPRSRLFLVGPADMGVPYMNWLKSLVEYSGLDPDVHFPGRVPHADLLAYYRLANAYICMSEHEGFCAPLVESMYLGTPVLAYSATAVPETLGDGGVLFHRKDYAAMAEMLHLIVQDGDFRDRMIARGRQRARAFDRGHVAVLLRKHLESLL